MKDLPLSRLVDVCHVLEGTLHRQESQGQKANETKAERERPSSVRCSPDAALVPALARLRMAAGSHCKVELKEDMPQSIPVACVTNSDPHE